jgi:hypothetical protein
MLLDAEFFFGSSCGKIFWVTARGARHEARRYIAQCRESGKHNYELGRKRVAATKLC